MPSFSAFFSRFLHNTPYFFDENENGDAGDLTILAHPIILIIISLLLTTVCLDARMALHAFVGGVIDDESNPQRRGGPLERYSSLFDAVNLTVRSIFLGLGNGSRPPAFCSLYN